MSRPVLELGPIVSGSFRTLFSDPILFILLPAGFFLVTNLLSLGLDPVSGQIATSLVMAILTAIITAGALAHARGVGLPRSVAFDGLTGSATRLIVYTIFTYIALFILGFIAYRLLLIDGQGTAALIFEAAWELAKSDGSPPEVEEFIALMTSNTEAIQRMAGRFAIVSLAFLLIILILSLILAPINAVLVRERAGFEALQRCFSLTRGYLLKIFWIYFVCGPIIFVIAILLGFAVGILSVVLLSLSMGPNTAAALASIVFAPATAWIFIVAVYVYQGLRGVKGELDSNQMDQVFN